MEKQTNIIAQKELPLVRQGDRNAFERIFRIYYGKVRNFVSLLVHSDSDAEDIAQDIFIKMWEKRSCFADIKSLDSYLYIMSRNAALDYIRKDKRYPEPEEFKDILYSGDDPDAKYLAMEQDLLIRMFVSTLPEKRRRIFEMSRYEGVSNDDIAKRLGISKKTVENQIHLVLSELKEMLAVMAFFGAICNF